MDIAIAGLGRMGMNMARRLIQGQHQVYVFNRTFDKSKQLEAEGAKAFHTLEQLVDALPTPRLIWLMLPSGKPTDDHIEKLASLLQRDDVIVDGGNSYYKNDLRHSAELEKKGIEYIDAGVSGGIWGLEKGYCMMLGGKKEIYERIVPVLDTLAPADGHLFCGGNGSGHFVKMVHNGIEYGMMQAYAEGFDILQASPYKNELDYAKLSHLWNQGSVVRSWLLELLEDVFSNDPRLNSLDAFVDDSGEGRWTVLQAVETGVAAEAITISLMRRFRSRQPENFGDRLLASLRNAFGGHSVKSKG